MSHHAFPTYFLLLIIQILRTSCDDPNLSLTTTEGFGPEEKNEWDLLIFTQRWPLTACSQWEEENKNNTCAFPVPKDLWTIHGIWPTKAGTIGPQNCNKTWHFNETIIDPIKSQLEIFWTNVEKNTQLNSLWKHEWSKHGTCAAVLPELDNELKYFKQGLVWVQQYNMRDVLKQQGVVPSDQGYSVQQIFDSVKGVLKKTAIIQCVIDRKTKLSLISEIRICFDKTLSLMDCDTVKHDDFVRVGKVLTNCDVKKPVMYPNKVTPNEKTRVPKETVSATNTVPSITTTLPIPNTITEMSTLESLYQSREHLLTLYKTIKLLIWVTI